MVRPLDHPLGLTPALAERPWNPSSLFQGNILAPVAIVVLVGIVLTLQPHLLPNNHPVRLLCGCGGQSTPKILKVVSVCSAFMFVGPLLIVLNKEIMQTLHFDLPLTLSCLGLLTTAMVVRSLVALGICEVRQETLDIVAGNGWFRCVLPIAFAKGLTLAMGNAVYLHLGLGFIQMLKAITPVIVCVVLAAFSLPLPSQVARWGLFLIISGTLVEVKGEMHATMVGLVLMFTSEICEAINLVLTQKLLHNYKFTLVEGIYVIAPPSGTLLLCAAAVLEGPKLFLEGRYRVVIDYPGYFVASCFLGLAVNFVGMAVVQATSSLTCKILNTVRGIGVIVFGCLFYGEICSNLEMCGYAVSLIGFTMYNVAQYNSDQKASASPLLHRQEQKTDN